MQTYTGIIEDMGRLVDRQSLDASRNSRGGKIEYIIIGKETIRRIGCPGDLYSFMKIGMEATIYVVSIPILGKAIVGVKDTTNGRGMMARNSEVIASCIMAWFVLTLLFIIPAFIMGVWQLGIIVPAVLAALLYFDYNKARAAK
jgi:hypothetical protein